jgi:hypothetical protein
MLGKAEGKHQVTEETEEQEGALPKDWRGEEIGTHHIKKISQCGATDNYQFVFRSVSHRTAYISNHNPGETVRRIVAKVGQEKVG